MVSEWKTLNYVQRNRTTARKYRKHLNKLITSYRALDADGADQQDGVRAAAPAGDDENKTSCICCASGEEDDDDNQSSCTCCGKDCAI